MVNETQQSRLSTGQKVGFSFMLVFAFLAIGLGMIQLRTNIFGPFVKANPEDAQAVDQAQILFDESVKLQRIDTDQDGLNDFEELTFYQTSPYLADTDSDGISDKKEIDNGTDPTCPEGKDCGFGEGNGFDAGVVDSTAGASPLVVVEPNPNAGGEENPYDLQAMFRDPVKLRAAIIATGQISVEDLSLISDADLMAYTEQALQKPAETTTQSGTKTPTSTTPPVADITPEQLEALLSKPAELRALLLSTGKMTQAQLDTVDDATLISATKDIIQSQRSQ